MQTRCDVLIVGARVAGSTLATLLGELGHQVVLIDRASFPSDTLSTHFFRPAGMVGMLQRLGVLEEVLATGAPRLVRFLNYTDGSATPEELPAHETEAGGYNLSIRRTALDDILVRRARRQPGVTVVERTRFLEPIWRDNRVAGARMETPEGPLEVSCTLLVGADGRHSSVAKAVNAANEALEPPIRDVAYVYVEGYEQATFDGGSAHEYSELENEAFYVFPSDAGVVCVAISAGLGDLGPEWLKIEAFFDAHIAHHHGLVERYRRSRRIGKMLRTSREENWIRVPVGPGWALLGDASVHQDPWTGRGMDMAAIHAGYLSEAIDDWLSGREDENTAMTAYHQRRNEHATPIFWNTQNVGRDLRLDVSEEN